MEKESILDVAKRIKENKLLKEKKEKEEKEKVRKDIKNTPYIKNCYFIGMLIKRYIKTTAYYSINIEALIDIDKIFLKGYPKEKSYEPKILLTKKAPSFYTDEDKKKFDISYKSKISICYNKSYYDIRVIIYHKLGAVEYDETFSIKAKELNKLYSCYVNSIDNKNIIKENIANFVTESLDNTYQNEFLKTKNKHIKKIMEICDAVVEVLNFLEINEVDVGEECF